MDDAAVPSPDGSTPDAAAGDASAPDASVDASAPSAFDPEPGFEVTGLLAHGGEVTVRRAEGGFGGRPHPRPWVWDRVSEQFVDGEREVLHEGLSDGDEVPNTLWRKTEQAGVGRRCRYRTARPLSHARLTASYGTEADGPTDRNHTGVVGEPRWPYAEPQANEQLYVSWWQRVGNGYGGPGGATGEDKVFRLSDTTGRGACSNYWSLAGATADTVARGNRKAWASLPASDRWMRFEIYADRARGHLDVYLDGALWVGSWSGAPGAFEHRPAADYLHVDPPLEGFAFDATGWINLTPNMIGYDDAGTSVDSDGQIVDFGEIYVDVSRARVEISERSTWDAHEPGATHQREVQGRLLRWSDTEITFVLDAGGFDTLSGASLFAITHDGEPVRVGRFR